MPTKKSKKRVKPKLSRLNAIDRIDSIRLCIDYGVDLQNRTLSLNGPVNDAMYERVVYGLSILNQLAVPSITIQLNTFGGDLYSALAIYDIVKLNKTPIDIVGIGQLMSAGTLIMQSARDGGRKVTKLTQSMLHYGNDAISGTFKDVQRYVAHVQEMEMTIEDIFCMRCNWTTEQYEALHRHDTYLSADEAKKMNLVDEVIG